MFSFFKKPTTEVKEETIDGSALPKQKLTLHPTWIDISQERRYVLQFLQYELPPMEEDEFGFSGAEISEKKGTIHVSAFIRSRIGEAYAPEEIILYLVNGDTEIIASKKLNVKELVGNIPAHSNMPWNFTFEPNCRTGLDVPSEDWQLLCTIPEAHRLDLDATWEDSLPVEQKEKLQSLFDKLDEMADNNLNFTGISNRFEDNGTFTVTAFVRNGYDQDVTISQLPLQIIDANDTVITQGAFEMNNFVVRANTSKPWSFTFGEIMVARDEIDLSKWRIVVMQ